MATRKKSSKSKEPTKSDPVEEIKTPLDMKLVLAASLLLKEMQEGIPSEVYRSFRSWEAYGKLEDLTKDRVKAVLSRNKDGVNFEKRLGRAKEFIDYVFGE